MAWTIRPARDDERDFVVGLAPRLAQGFELPAGRTAGEIVRAESEALLAALERPDDQQAVLIAERDDGTRGGLVYLQRQVDYFRQAPHAHVSILVVGAEVEGQGAGSRLLDAAEHWARDQGFDMITLHVFDGNRRARAVYERHGYAPEYSRYVKRL
ncbi:MAG: GNAT family N-acetyltransferase [Gemmatimonadales bacterium]|nr:GNAT family N-acetyltransferase [Gemmatimonadales bacterium]